MYLLSCNAREPHIQPATRLASTVIYTDVILKTQWHANMHMAQLLASTAQHCQEVLGVLCICMDA